MSRPGVIRWVRCTTCRLPMNALDVDTSCRKAPECQDCREDRLGSPHVIDAPTPADVLAERSRPDPPARTRDWHEGCERVTGHACANCDVNPAAKTLIR